jgi:hypothetical protein
MLRYALIYWVGVRAALDRGGRYANGFGDIDQPIHLPRVHGGAGPGMCWRCADVVSCGKAMAHYFYTKLAGSGDVPPMSEARFLRSADFVIPCLEEALASRV